MPHKNSNIVSQEEPEVAIHVANWLIVALPHELADALDTYAASFEPGVTASAAARRILQSVLLEDIQPCMPGRPAVSPTGAQSRSRPIATGQA
jgi:hypothetical protein